MAASEPARLWSIRTTSHEASTRAPSWASELESLAAAQRTNVSATHRGVDCPRRLSGRNRPFHRRDRRHAEDLGARLDGTCFFGPECRDAFCIPRCCPAYLLDDEHAHPTRYALYRCRPPCHQHP